jgi:hypothetical protein
MATKKIEVSVDFMKSVCACGTAISVEDVDSVAYGAFYHLKKNNIKPYCKFESYEDYAESYEG